ncbi:DUF3499 domain-containing protein [Tsukamurella paurometabola]|uniref:DUF3499 domain-containing protein n=1 Tax=Tsukamurella paurometabola TaxID=2061 RepID=A0ABS5NDH4_TSUPA|nr:DUF3499 domain-containing protein [Tsukamurella paurometabola]MBS4101498.1 DUF3499 domain-containing protein [Tsukamurella paurometabola]UEA84621.1 DUF3499 domain-containing protein [Tsukamurella paurometabola]
MNSVRQCCRPGCRNHAVATLTFDYRQSIAVLGPLGTTSEPHSWDLCEFHATRMTAPRGWEMLRNLSAYSAASVGNAALDDDLTALADTVHERAAREQGRHAPESAEAPLRSLPPIGAMRPVHDGLGGPQATPSAQPGGSAPKHAARPGRRGHLRVLPDPVD